MHRDIVAMEALLPQALRLFVGSALSPVESKRDLPDLAGLGSPTVFSLCPSRKLRNMLRHQGYTDVHSFVIVPSRNMPRWLLPAGDHCGMLAGTRMYQPHKWAPRAIKKALIGMMKMGWNGGWCSKVLIASTDKLALETLVLTVTGEAQPVFAMSLGRQAAVRKLTVQVMRPSGDILGYVKLPLTDAAIERVRNEARIVEQLWSFPTLRPHIPRVLYSGNWNGTYLVFQSPLEGERGPVIFNSMHEGFLRALWDVHGAEIPGQAVINAVAAKWERAVRHLGREWEEIGEELLRRSTHDLQRKTLRCGVMHGDLAPWNTRVRQEQLLLFDWESADWQAPNSWDIFHFQVRSSYFLHKHEGLQIPKREASDESSFMLYALSSVCQLVEEENPKGIDLHKKLLVRAFQQKQAWLEDPVSAI